MSLTKIDITETIREKFSIPKKDCVRIVESLVTSHIKLIRYSYNRLMFCNKG
jgi:hypothetical protein